MTKKQKNKFCLKYLFVEITKFFYEFVNLYFKTKVCAQNIQKTLASTLISMFASFGNLAACIVALEGNSLEK